MDLVQPVHDEREADELATRLRGSDYTVDSVESAPATSTLNIPVVQSPSIHVVKSSTTASVTVTASGVSATRRSPGAWRSPTCCRSR